MFDPVYEQYEDHEDEPRHKRARIITCRDGMCGAADCPKCNPNFNCGSRHTFDHMDEILLRLSDATETQREARMRRKTVLMDQEGTVLIAVGPSPQGLVDNGQVTLGMAMSKWDLFCWLAPWAVLGFFLGSLIVAAVIINT